MRTNIKQHNPLTPRETQVSELLARGLSRKEIAAELGIAYNTAIIYVRRVRWVERARGIKHN